LIQYTSNYSDHSENDISQHRFSRVYFR